MRTTAAGPSRVSHQPIVIDSDDSEGDDFAAPILPTFHRAKALTLSSSSTSRHAPAPNGSGGDLLAARDKLKAQLSELDQEIQDVRKQIRPLQLLLEDLEASRTTLESELASLSQPSASDASRASKPSSSRTDRVDYQTSNFPWSDSLPPLLSNTFGIPSFRLCQEGVVNAAIDGRDIVCVMPTGGGKSLTYQLPAVIGSRGVTVVISPLLALIWDQVRAMGEIGVESVMLTGATSKEEQNDIYRRLENAPAAGRGEIRLCYLTPEKISKSKRLMSVLEKVVLSLTKHIAAVNSVMAAEDFRPDYKKLSVLKTLFPRVPIQAVTATLSTKTLPDLLKILRLPPICDGRNANSNGTVFFTSPLYRPNLHYRVLHKPSAAKAAIDAMRDWIQQNHAGESGIVYCLSKKDAETVADALREASRGQIKTGVYHAGIDDHEKERIHVQWRRGVINCICATIAFGLGIDKGDVRFVIHHSISKSLDGYYQETGRAGRDGKDSDCVLFYRAQDASRLTSLVYTDTEGSDKLREMIRFAQDLGTCRKIAFAKYFATSASLSASAWDHAATLSSDRGGTLTTCGICDNCLRDPSSLITRDVTIDSWKILTALREVDQEGGRVTVGGLCDLVRGLGKGVFAVKGGKKGKTVGESELDMDAVAGGKVMASKNDVERLVVHLVLQGYIQETYHATAYAVNVYLRPASMSTRLTRLSLEQVESGQGIKLECTFPDPKAGKTKRGVSKRKGKKEVVELSDGELGSDATEMQLGDSGADDDLPRTPKKRKSSGSEMAGAVKAVKGRKKGAASPEMDDDRLDWDIEYDDDDIGDFLV